MPKPTLRGLICLLCLGLLTLAACSTVAEFAAGHVIFPKEAVRGVFELMEKDLTLPGQTTLGPMSRQTPAASDTSSLTPASRGGCPKAPAWWPVGVACAQEQSLPSIPILPVDPQQALLDELRGMVEVREALLSRRQRMALVLQWKREGIVGESRDATLVFLMERGQVEREVLARVANENDDRSILMRAVAKAVVIINGVEPSKRNIVSQIEATKKELAAVRRRISPEGTWVQLPDGQWIKK